MAELDNIFLAIGGLLGFAISGLVLIIPIIKKILYRTGHGPPLVASPLFPARSLRRHWGPGLQALAHPKRASKPSKLVFSSQPRHEFRHDYLSALQNHPPPTLRRKASNI